MAKSRNFQIFWKIRNKRKHLIVFVLAILIAASLLLTHETSRSVFRGSFESESETLKTPEFNRVVYGGSDFKRIWENTNPPNIERITKAPHITGNAKADERIQNIALSRGYQLQINATGKLAFVDGEAVQPNLADDWNKLLSAARTEGVEPFITSGYRSIEDQRSIFLRRFNAAGGNKVSLDQVANGDVDDIINGVLQTSSIPGFSRHHSGYAIDLGDRRTLQTFHDFNRSPSYRWLSDDNFSNAKKFGFIPSYPEDGENQGPEPEPWEFIWVGTENLKFKREFFGL